MMIRPPTPDPAWMTIARTYLGTREMLQNGQPNPLIAEFFQATGFKGGDAGDAWCSAFANHCMQKAGLKGSGKANARSWLAWGGRQLTLPTTGCVVVFARPPEPASGHVAFFVSEEKNWINVLGGNQANAVCVRPYARARLLGYRAPG